MTKIVGTTLAALLLVVGLGACSNAETRQVPSAPPQPPAPTTLKWGQPSKVDGVEITVHAPKPSDECCNTTTGVVFMTVPVDVRNTNAFPVGLIQISGRAGTTTVDEFAGSGELEAPLMPNESLTLDKLIELPLDATDLLLEVQVYRDQQTPFMEPAAMYRDAVKPEGTNNVPDSLRESSTEPNAITADPKACVGEHPHDVCEAAGYEWSVPPQSALNNAETACADMNPALLGDDTAMSLCTHVVDGCMNQTGLDPAECLDAVNAQVANTPEPYTDDQIRECEAINPDQMSVEFTECMAGR